MWVRFPVAALVSFSKTLNHNCFVLRMGRKAVGPVCCVIHVKEPSIHLSLRRGLPRCFWLAPRNRQLDWWRFTNVDWIGLDMLCRILHICNLLWRRSECIDWILPYTNVCMKNCILSAFQLSVKNSTGDSGGIQTHDLLLTNAHVL